MCVEIFDRQSAVTSSGLSWLEVDRNGAIRASRQAAPAHRIRDFKVAAGCDARYAQRIRCRARIAERDALRRARCMHGRGRKRQTCRRNRGIRIESSSDQGRGAQHIDLAGAPILIWSCTRE